MEFHEKAIYLYIHGLLQLASKRVLSGSDCLKIDGGWGFAGSPQTPQAGGVDPYGTGGTRPPNIWTGGT